MNEGGWTSRAAVKQAASLGGMGLLAGVLAGWVALLGAEDVAARAARAASVFWVLFLLLPATLLLWSWLSWREQRGTRQVSLGRAVAVSLAVGLAGGLLAVLAFVAAFDPDPADVRRHRSGAVSAALTCGDRLAGHLVLAGRGRGNGPGSGIGGLLARAQSPALTIS